jgi:hypothetical protein
LPEPVEVVQPEPVLEQGAAAVGGQHGLALELEPEQERAQGAVQPAPAF